MYNEPIKLKPFIRKGLDILFVALNPSIGSSKKGHYFSVRRSFWKQLYESGLTLQELNKDFADDFIFGSTEYNYNNWSYGITDLIPYKAESDSSKIRPTIVDYKRLEFEIRKYKPKIVIIIHNKVLKEFICNYLKIPKHPSNSGKMGKLMHGCNSIFYNIAFPHGSSISDSDKIRLYTKVKDELSQMEFNKIENKK